MNNKYKFIKLAKNLKTDNEKIVFFDSYQEAFIPDSNYETFSRNEKVPKEIDDAFYVYANMKRMNEKELEELKDLPWRDFPNNFKIFLFDFCFLNSY
tara:strand:+ start:106 stop:396 length:291 start_codon:yes stop_codon:yes gene_type:complete